MTSAGVAPKNGEGSAGMSGANATPTTQPTNAATSIVPSMPMFTTPDRSQTTPHMAASVRGAATRSMIGATTGSTLMR